ncbi:MAG TPA: hypothetical protein VFY79_03245 [Dehalococcoidia bacterium]|jgi:hypothetical protein|nr:hypothetical protein [Dehalococcoidia bacterium]
MKIAAVIFVCALLLGGMPLGAPPRARADQATPTATTLTIDGPASVRAGRQANVDVSLFDATGSGVGNAGLVLSADGTQIATATTRGTGVATFALPGPLSAGMHHLVVRFAGDAARGLLPSNASFDFTLLTPTSTQITIDPLPASGVGVAPELHLTVTGGTGKPLAEVNVKVSIDGVYAGQVRTDASGAASLTLPDDLRAGVHHLEAAFAGQSSHNLAPANADLDLNVVPSAITIHTVPALKGAQFELTPLVDGQLRPDQKFTITAGADGVATTPFDHPSAFALRALPWGDEPGSQMQAEFDRWDEDYFYPQRLIWVSSNADFTAGYDLRYLVHFNFADLQGKNVDRARIQSVTFRNSSGEETTVHDGDTVWTRASGIMRRKTRLESTKVLYSVASVMIDGSNVVNKSEQSFFPADDQDISIKLLLFSLRVRTRDVIFGFSMGSSASLTHPDGRTEIIGLNSDHQLRLDSLPRGQYSVKIHGWGISGASPIALSQDQDVQLRVVSYLDVVFVLFALSAVAVGLLVYGRRRTLLRNRRLRQFLVLHASED